MVIDRNVKIGIVTSIIATILFIYFIDPILTLFGRTLLQLASRIYSSYVDHLFEKAALCTTMDQAYVLLNLVMGLISGSSVGICAGIIIAKIMKKKGLPPSELPKIVKLTTFKAVTLGLSAVLFVNLLSFFTLWDGWFQLKTISSFQQHMKAVAPYLEEREEKQLWSKWTQMRSRQDYDAIYVRLKTVANAHDLRLPENRVYSSSSI